jgi:quinolinate synthase
MTQSATTERLVEKILRLKKERQALIVAHNYQVGEIQDVADFVGDSLELSQTAARTSAKVLVFCGVHFMAETAAILCPDKTVLIPDLSAGCGMSEMISAEEVRKIKREHPGALVVAYVNTSAAVKAESDVCCTSSNAVTVVQSIPREREIIFIPDQYLGRFVERQTGRKMILYNGYCPTHFRITISEVEKAKREHPAAAVVAHPECLPDVSAKTDRVLSTSGICRSAGSIPQSEIIVATEIGILHRLRRENPEKTFVPACSWCDCAHMKVNSLEKLLWSLEDMEYPVIVPEPTLSRARRAIDRMMEISEKR